MDVPRLFKTATPEFVARKVFRIKTVKRDEKGVDDDKEKIELTVHEPEHMIEDTSSTDTGTPRMENGTKLPVLAAGTYHRKEAAPILAAAARLDNVPTTSKTPAKTEPAAPPLPHPSECGQPCISEQSEMFQHRTTNAQGPPPAWQPPRPPGQRSSVHDYTNDYEDPEELAKSRGDCSSNLLIKTTPPPMPHHFNSYEMSLSQQRRSQQVQPMAPLLDWSQEGGVLHKNAEGAYYIPSGSLRTTSSTLSPASGQRYMDQPHTSGSGPPNPATYSDASTTLLKYPLTGTQPNRRRQVATMNGETTMSKKKKNIDDDDGFCQKPTKCVVLLAIALILAIICIVFMLLKSPSYVYTEPSPSADAASATASLYAERGLRALPPAISLGERIDVEFFPRHMATTELVLSKASRIIFNATVGSGAQLVLLIRHGVPPSLSLHDALFPIRADRIRDPKAPTHIVEEATRVARSVGPRMNAEILAPRSTTFEQFLLEGRHFLTFINERNRVEPISFLAEELVKPKKVVKSGEHPLTPILTCEANCNNRGECIHGKCACANGFTGKTCEEAICPIVCSGNGVFSGGICICKAGFKGKECEMRANWCEVADCNGKGRCDTDGKCRCNNGWTGESCELKACPHPSCNDRGICQNGICYCMEGWRGTDCSVFADSVVVNPQKHTQTTAQPRKATPKYEKPKKVDEKKAVVNRELPKELETEKCNNHGTLSEGSCICSDGYEGYDCSKKTCEKCINGDCNNGLCACWGGWRGANCSYPECITGCEDHGKCMEDGACQCSKGWNGDNCYQEGCPNQCSHKGECVLDNRSSEWMCQCQSGTTGSDCSVPIELHCDDGLDNDNDGLVDCEDPDCCSSNICSEDSFCSTSISPAEVVLRMPPVFNANFAQRIGFLIAEKSVQSYTDVAQFNDSLVTVIRGRIMWKGPQTDDLSDKSSGTTVPLVGVRVSDANHPLYGFTLTRNDGYFDLVVNGARSVTLQCLRNSFKPIKKVVYVPASQIVHIDDIILSRSSGSQISTPPLPARAKCSPTTRKLRDITLIKNWDYSTDGVESDSAKLVIDSRSIVDSIPILGTDLKISYDSLRSPSAPSTMVIGLLDNVVDKDLRKIHLNIRIAGRKFDYLLAPKLNLTHIFTWDKKNAYRRNENGLIPITVKVGYEYANCERDSEIVWITRRSEMMGAVTRKMIGDMWTIDIHHHLDIVNNIVEMGDGGHRLISEYEPRVTTYAGIDGTKRDIECTTCDGFLDKIALFRPTALAYALDGSLLIGDHNLIRRIGLDGSVNTVLTLSLADTSHSYYLAVSPADGTVAISLPLHKQVWKIISLTPEDSRNNYEIFAGDGSVCGSAVDSCGDSGLAQNSQLIFPKGIAFDMIGNLYLADSRRIRVIDISGHIRSIGETTPESHPIRQCAQITKLVDLQMEWPTSISIDGTTGMIYVLDTNVVYQIDLEHNYVTTALGAPSTCDQSNSTSIDHRIQNARDIHVRNDGAIYIVESDGKRMNQVRKLSADRSEFVVVIGGKSPCSCDVAACGCDDSTSQKDLEASAAHLNSPHAAITSSSGELMIADSGNAKIKKVMERLGKYDPKSRNYEVTDSEKMEKFTFNRHGLHTSTVSMITGKAIYNFSYNVDSPNAHLTSIQGSSGIMLRLNHHSQHLIDFETSLGEVTSLTISTLDNFLESVSRKGATTLRDSIKFTYIKKGLLTSRVEVANSIIFEYDEYGRAKGLRKDREYWQLGQEVVQMGRLNLNLNLNGQRQSIVKIGDGDLSIQNMNGGTTRLITLKREGYSMTSPLTTSSLFDKSTGTSISRRRTTVPAITDPARRALTTRWDWRYVKRKDDNRRTAEVGFRPRINGINMFSMEYSVAQNRDTLHLGSSTDDAPKLLKIDYTDSGKIRRIRPESDSPIAEMNITWDSNGRKTLVQWGNLKKECSYDSSNRIVTVGEDDARVPTKMTYTGASRRPNTIHHDGATFNIQYDNYDRVKEVSSPSGEVTTFSSISLGGEEWVLKRRSSLNSKPSLVRIGNDEEILEAATPDGLYHYMVKKENDGRISQILNNGRITVAYCWSPEGDVLCTRNEDVQEITVLQGHLIARKTTNIGKLKSSFSYEYDDILRPISVQPIIEQSVLEPIQISYDEKKGRINTINGFTVIRDSSTVRCQGYGIHYEVSRANPQLLVVERKIVFGDAKISMKIGRDKHGRAVNVEFNIGVDQRTVRRTFDASGRIASVEEDKQEKMILQWNKDGRVDKIGDLTAKYSRGGAIERFLETQYSTNSIGWVLSRNNCSFEYDGLGRLVNAVGKNGKTWKLIYNQKSQLISISSDNYMMNMYRGDVENPTLITHFSKNGKISTIFYEDGSPFAMASDDGTRYGLLVDDTSTLLGVVGNSEIMKTMHRSTFGEVLQDSYPGLDIPLGYLGGVDIPEIGVTVLDNGRPLDLISGRYLSTNPKSSIRLDFDDFSNSIDAMALESERSPWALIKIPEDISTWFKMVGMSPHLLPSTHLGLPKPSPVIHRLLSSFPRKLDPLSHLNSILPTKLSVEKADSLETEWSIEDVGFSNLLVLNINETGLCTMEPVQELKKEEVEVMKKLIDGAELLDFSTWSPVPVRHLYRPKLISEVSSTSFPHFTLVANNDNVEIRNGKTKIIIHFNSKKKDVIKKLVDELRSRENVLAWKAERTRVESGKVGSINWNDREQRELKSKGTVSGYQVEMRYFYQNAFFATIHSWKFSKI